MAAGARGIFPRTRDDCYQFIVAVVNGELFAFVELKKTAATPSAVRTRLGNHAVRTGNDVPTEWTTIPMRYADYIQGLLRWLLGAGPAVYSVLGIKNAVMGSFNTTEW